MALTTLDPNTALIIVDLQKGIVGLPLHPSRRGRHRAGARAGRRLPRARPAGGARQRRRRRPGRTEQPRQTGFRPDGWTDLVPELSRATGRHRRDETDLGRVRKHRSRGRS